MLDAQGCLCDSGIFFSDAQGCLCDRGIYFFRCPGSSLGRGDGILDAQGRLWMGGLILDAQGSFLDGANAFLYRTVLLGHSGTLMARGPVL